MKRFLVLLAAMLLGTAGMTGAARAQDQGPDQGQVQAQGGDSQNNPGAARVSLVRGNVSMQRGDTGDWEAVTENTPLFAGDSISTGEDSRAEIQLDYASVIRLNSNSTVKIANLDRNNIQVQVAQGLVNYDVLVQDQAQEEVDTPSVAVHPLGNGRYRIEVDPNDQSLVTVVSGEADISTPQGSTRVEAGQLITIQGLDNPQYKIADAGPADDWDRWNQERDSQIADSGAWHHTDRYYTGAQDLDAHGRWTYVPEYGQVWEPDVQGDWAPYRDGRWVWEPYYGWTWVSYEPWGWAPYHYGRWFLNAGVWCWWPGPLVDYPDYWPVWSPAYVSFFGFGYGGFGFSFGAEFGNVGWFPCGPGDYFYPWYGGGGSLFVFNFNDFDRDRGFDRGREWGPLFRGRDGVSNFDRIRTDARLRDGASWMRASQFGRAPVPRQQGGVSLASFQQARVFSGRVPVVPTRDSLRMTAHDPNPGTIRNGKVMNQHFFNGGRPAARQTPFTVQQSQMERAVQDFRNQRGSGTASNRPFGANPAQSGGGNGRGTGPFGSRPAPSPRPAFQAGSPSSPAARSGNGWRSFGGGNQVSRGNSAWTLQGGSVRARGNTGFTASSPAYRGQPAQAPAQRQGGWRAFTPSARPAAPAQGRSNYGAPAGQGPQGNRSFSTRSERPPTNPPPAGGHSSAPSARPGGWHAFTPSSRPYTQAGGWQQSGRQPLDLRQPIMQQRRNSPSPNYSYSAPRYNSGGYYRGGNNGGRAPAYQAPSYRAPAYRAPSYRAPAYQAPAYRAPAYRAPAPSRSYGGGYRGGGGGSYSRGGGGSYSRGGGGGGGRSNHKH